MSACIYKGNLLLQQTTKIPRTNESLSKQEESTIGTLNKFTNDFNQNLSFLQNKIFPPQKIEQIKLKKRELMIQQNNLLSMTAKIKDIIFRSENSENSNYFKIIAKLRKV